MRLISVWCGIKVRLGFCLVLVLGFRLELGLRLGFLFDGIRVRVRKGSVSVLSFWLGLGFEFGLGLRLGLKLRSGLGLH